MMVHIASPADAEEISALITELGTPFFVSPTRQGEASQMNGISFQPMLLRMGPPGAAIGQAHAPTCCSGPSATLAGKANS